MRVIYVPEIFLLYVYKLVLIMDDFECSEDIQELIDYLKTEVDKYYYR